MCALIAEQVLEQLRALRGRARLLHEGYKAGFKSYLNQDGVTYRQLPSDAKSPADVSVSSSCSVLMAMALGSGNALSRDPFERIWAAQWMSSGLPEGNAFTRTLALRALGMAVDVGGVDRDLLPILRHPSPAGVETFDQHLEDLFAGVPASLSVLGYPPHPTLAYWLVDATIRLKHFPKLAAWEAMAAWAAKEFATQRSRVSAGNDALADPIAMAMAACVLRKLLRRGEGVPALEPHVRQYLPSDVELIDSVRRLFLEFQRPSGLWGKYFPLFHYPSGQGGSNHTFSFELLEAIVSEFADLSILTQDWMIAGLQRSLGWCETNQLHYPSAGDVYHGWNSGGRVQVLLRGEPESWATAVVHMFLQVLIDNLSGGIREILLQRYKAERHVRSSAKWDDFLDIDLTVAGPTGATTVKTLLRDELLEPASKVMDFRRMPPSVAVSALLFGPPGTSKTSLVRAIARYLGLPYLEITPSDFLQEGLDAVYQHANRVFDDLADLWGAVVLFDELDGLVHARRPQESGGVLGTILASRREDALLDPRREFLTTSMLPKLAQLHEQRQVLFFWATNYLSGFDPAIRRAGRFDLLIQMGPPNLASKTSESALAIFVEPRSAADRATYAEAANLLRQLVDQLGTGERKTLSLFTFGDMQSFLRQLCHGEPLATALRGTSASNFKRMVNEWGSVMTLADRSLQKQYEAERVLSRIQK